MPASQQRTHPRARSVQRDINNDARAPCPPRFPHAVYNMAVAACHLHDIPDTSDPETNGKLREPRHFLNIALKKQAECSLSRCRNATNSMPS